MSEVSASRLSEVSPRNCLTTPPGWLALVALWPVAVVFVLFGALKVADPSILESYFLDLLPWSGLAFWAARGLAWIEIFVGCALFMPALARFAAMILVVLSMVFIQENVMGWLDPAVTYCSCAPIPIIPVWVMVIFNAYSIAAGLFCIVRGSHNPSKQPSVP